MKSSTENSYKNKNEKTRRALKNNDQENVDLRSSRKKPDSSEQLIQHPKRVGYHGSDNEKDLNPEE